MANFNNILGSVGSVVKVSSTEINKITSSIASTTNISNLVSNNLNLPLQNSLEILKSTDALTKLNESVSANLENSKKVLLGEVQNPLSNSVTASADSIISTNSPTENLVQEENTFDNVLHNYANYTYSLSLHVIPIEKYNNIMFGQDYYTDDGVVLIASGGRDNEEFVRNEYFTREFYFENLSMTTVVGLNSQTRNTNAINVNFTIIEPYGFTLINNLLKVAAQYQSKSWFEMPFMLQIEFFGNDDSGSQWNPIPNTTKHIPIKLISCKSKVTTKGAEYQIQGIPYNHSAFNESTASTPAVLKVQANTLTTFFSATDSAGEAANIIKFKKASEERQDQISKEIDDERKKNPKSTRISELENQKKNLSQDVSNTGFIVFSYAAAINSYQLQLKENNHITYPDQYKFVFNPEILQGKFQKIVFPKKTELKTTPMISVNSPGGISAIRAQAGLPVAGPDANKEIFTINAGTSIIEVINQVMRSTEYIRSQFEDPTLNDKLADQMTKTSDGQEIANKLEKEIRWYKITPVIKINNFDEKLNKYSRTITYHIDPYTYQNSKFRDAPKSVPKKASKFYNYMYTGKNSDIIDFNIDFDTLFFTAITADKFKSQLTKIQQGNLENPDSGGKNSTEVKVQLPVTHPVTGQSNMPDPASVDNKSILINDFAAATMSGSRGDMINLDLKIIGDPQLIKQDDVMYNPNNKKGESLDGIDSQSGSIVFDSGEVFAEVVFKTPLDFDEKTGLMIEESAETSVFSGLYKIITVENEFSQGTFVQTLKLVRIFEQPEYDTINASKIQNNQRDKEITTPAEQASKARAEFAATDERRIEYQDIKKAAKARAEFAATDERRIKNEETSAMSKIESGISAASGFLNSQVDSLKKWWKS